MKTDLKIPPQLSRLTRYEFGSFWIWAAGLVKNLRAVLYNLDDDNIKSVSASKLTGSIDLSSNPMYNDVLAVSDGNFLLSNADGSQYIRLENGVLTIKANIISDE